MVFSIIVPMYNTETYIRECLESIAAQDYSSFECIIINDGSVDGSAEIASKYCEVYKNFRMITQENQGLSAARNTGMRNAIGDYIVFVDSDDFIKKDALNNLQELISKSGNADVIISTTYAYYEHNKELILRDWSPKEKRLKSYDALRLTFRDPSFLVAAWTLTCKRTYLLDNKLYFENGLKHEDELWFPQTIVKAETIIINPAAFYCNRCDRVGSITHSPDIKKIKDKIYIITELTNICENLDSDTKNEIQYRQAQLYAGIIKELWKYKITRDLENEIRNGAHILVNTDGNKYKLLYVIIKFVGPYITSQIMKKAFVERRTS